MLDESICHFRGVRSILSLLFYFSLKILLANTVDPDDNMDIDTMITTYNTELTDTASEILGKEHLGKSLGSPKIFLHTR